MGEMMAEDSRYQMSVQEVKDLITAGDREQCKFDIVLTGGEPLMWKNLVEGVAWLSMADCVNTITMFTNAGFPDRLTSPLVGMLDDVRISEYFYNKDNVARLLTTYPDKVHVVDRTGFWKNPEGLLPEAEAFPVVCMNPEILLYAGNVYACPHNLAISLRVKAATQLSVPLSTPGFLAELRRIKNSESHKMGICRACISNQTVRRVVEKTMNISGSRYTIPGIPSDSIPGYAAIRQLTVPQQLVQLTLPVSGEEVNAEETATEVEN